jgi:dTDP-4-dehydrorhamnose reductase
VSKHQFGLKVAKEFRLDPSLILAGKITDREDLVRRPLDMSLSNQKARRVLRRGLGSVDEQLHRLRQQEELQLNRELLKL